MTLPVNNQLPQPVLGPYVDEPTIDMEKSQNMNDGFYARHPTYVPGTVLPINAGFTETAHARHRSRRRRIFVRALHFLTATAIFALLLPTCVRNVAHFTGYLRKLCKHGHSFESSHGGSAAQEDVKDCVHFAEWTGKYNQPYPSFLDIDSYPDRHDHLATTSLSLPVDSKLLYLVSSGHLSNGVVAITADGETKDAVTVEVNFYYHHSEFLDEAKVCLLERDDGENGVGIFTPHHPPHEPHHDPHHRSVFTVKVRLPAPEGKDRLEINAFETSMPLFSHIVDDLEDVVAFKSLKLKTSNGPILAKSVLTKGGSIQTSNGPIYGNFTTSDSLLIQTSNSPITVNATLLNASPDHPTDATLKTSNGHIVSNFTLISTTDDHTGGAFKVTTRTSNSPLNADFIDAPVDSILSFEGHTSNSPVNAHLHKTYEGDFFLRTSTWFPLTVHADEDVEDPAGKGRSREVRTKKLTRGTAQGTAKWVPAEERDLGNVVLSTSNSPLHLSL